MKKRTYSVFLDCIKKNKISLYLFAIISLFNCIVFFLYNLNLEPFIYAEIISFIFLILLLFFDIISENKKSDARYQLKNNLLVADTKSIDIDTLKDKDYLEIINELLNKIDELETSFSTKQKADDDYYSSWVHQIKTPIAVMKLSLNEDNEKDRSMSLELFRIEQYVEMVLDYTRLASDSNDLLFTEYSLDDIIKETLRKFAPLFITRKLKLVYEPYKSTVVTDKKWLSFILEQLISNAIKYTPSGEISITVSESSIIISDTGIGIAPEDIPRIFEKGYTGSNGRLGQKSSGLGLFLVKKAADLLSLSVSVESTVGFGSKFIVNFENIN